MRRDNYFIFLFAGLAFLISFLIFTPGLMSRDSLAQYAQVIGAVEINNFQPPIMIWIWKFTNLFYRGPESLFFLLVFTYWLSFACLSVILGKSFKHKLAILLVGLFPPLYNMSLHLWKDIVMLVFLMLSVTLALQFLKTKNLLLIFMAIILSFIGGIARHNSFLSVFVLLAFYSYWLFKHRFKAIFGFWFPFFILLIIMYFSLYKFVGNYKVYGKYNFYEAVSAVILGDLEGISITMEKNVVPKDVCGQACEGMSDDQMLSQWVGEYTPCSNMPIHDFMITINKNTWTFDYSRFRDGKNFWYFIDQVKAHPAAYLKHRLRILGCLFQPHFTYQEEVPKNIFGIKTKNRQLVRGLLFITTFIFKPFYCSWIYFLFLSYCLFQVVFRKDVFKRDPIEREVLSMLSLSAIAYVIVAFFMIPGGDFRFNVWLVFAGVLSFIIFCQKHSFSVSRKNEQELL